MAFFIHRAGLVVIQTQASRRDEAEVLGMQLVERKTVVRHVDSLKKISELWHLGWKIFMNFLSDDRSYYGTPFIQALDSVVFQRGIHF